jgi:cyclic pyranopterin phosphate synthase
VSEPFCYYPFTQLLLQPTGAVSACCWTQEKELGRVPEQSLEEIWNGEALRELRREFLQGKPVACAVPIRNRNCHLGSHRDFSKGTKPQEIMPTGPVRLDLRLNGQCNLRCVMCDIWEQPNGVYDNSDFWTYGPEKVFPFLREIELLGGEPFLQRDMYRLIDAVSAVNSDCLWRLATNGHYKVREPILRALDKIRIDRIHVSLDSLRPEVYREIRLDGELERPLETLRDFGRYQKQRKARGRDFLIAVSICVQQKNWQELEDFLRFCAEGGYVPYVQFASVPWNESLLSLEKTEREKILNYFFSLLPLFGGPVLRPLMVPLADSLA